MFFNGYLCMRCLHVDTVFGSAHAPLMLFLFVLYSHTIFSCVLRSDECFVRRASVTVNVLLCYCVTVLLCYCVTVLLCYCVNVLMC